MNLHAQPSKKCCIICHCDSSIAAVLSPGGIGGLVGGIVGSILVSALVYQSSL